MRLERKHVNFEEGWFVSPRSKKGRSKKARPQVRKPMTADAKVALKRFFVGGTRSEDGRLQPLKMGAVGLVSRLRRSVVPVSVVDTCRANPKGACKIRSGTVHVVFHAPIPPAENLEKKAGRKLRNELAFRITAEILSALPEDQRSLEAAADGHPPVEHNEA
jgi:1-acyl-sn-glycerol-3-phosphate acyltransferase